MTRVQADSALKAALTRNGDRVEIVDDKGMLLGIAYGVAGVYAQADATFDPEEHRKTLADPRKYTTDELIQKLGLP